MSSSTSLISVDGKVEKTLLSMYEEKKTRYNIEPDRSLLEFWHQIGPKTFFDVNRCRANGYVSDFSHIVNMFTQDVIAKKMMSRLLYKDFHSGAIRIQKVTLDTFYNMLITDSLIYSLADKAIKQSLSKEDFGMYSGIPLSIENSDNDESIEKELVIEVHSKFLCVIGKRTADPRILEVYVLDLYDL